MVGESIDLFVLDKEGIGMSRPNSDAAAAVRGIVCDHGHSLLIAIRQRLLKWTVPVKERKYLRAEEELEEIVDDVGDNNLTNFIAMVTTWLRQKQRNLDYNQQTTVEK